MKKSGNRNFLFVIIMSIFLISFISASIELNTALLKVSLHTGETSTKPFSIRGIKDDSVSLEVINLVGSKLSEDSFFISASEVKTVNVNFDSTNLTPGVYFGYVSIKTKEDEKKLPLLLEVESKDVLFDADLNIPPVYSEVYPGGRIISQVSIFDLTFGTDEIHSYQVDLEYSIHKSDGTLISSEQERVVVNGDTTLTKSISLPKNIEEDVYFVTLVVKYGNSVGVSSSLFSVNNKTFFDNSLFNFSYLGWIVFLIIILFIIFVFIYLLRDRDKMFLEIKKQNCLELQSQRKFLLDQQNILLKNKKINPAEVKKEIKEKIISLKEKQRERVKEYKNITKIRDKKQSSDLMAKKLREWKSLGYNTILLESKLKGMNASDMKTIMSRWKGQGYK